MDGITQRGLPASPDEESASLMSTAPAASPDGWKVDRVDIRLADNGGFIVGCSKSRQTPQGGGNGGGNGPSPVGGASDYQSKEYAFSSLGEVMGFVEQEFGGGQAAPVGNAGASAPASPPMSGY